MKSIVAAISLLAALAALWPGLARAQSFDCREARYRDEMLICQAPDLARLDHQLATLYREKFGSLPKERQDEFQQHEAYFVNARRECRDDHRCIEQSYRNRIQELENLLSEDEQEESSSATRPADDQPERPVGAHDSRNTRSERPLEPSGSTAIVPPTPLPESRSESGMTSAATRPAEAPQPQWSERSDKPRKATRTSEHHGDHRSARSERPLEPSGSSNATTPREIRSETDMGSTVTRPAETPEPLWSERSGMPRKAPRTSEHHGKRSRASAAAAPQPEAIPRTTAAEHVAADRPAAANDAPAKPTIKWVNPAPVR